MTSTKQRAEQDREDWRWLLGDARGRRILWALLSQCQTFSTGITGSPKDYYQTGRRDVGVGIFNQIMEVDPDAYLRMTKEHQDYA